MRYIPKLSILCFLSTIYISNSFGQSVQNDSTYLDNAQKQTIANFNKAIGQQSRLYSGREYFLYDPVIKGNAYFPNDAPTWAPGEVNYNGITYTGVPLMYDIYKDVVVTLLYNGFSRYILVNERVHDFTFSYHHFVRVEVDSLKKDRSGISTGFYDQLYIGKIEVLAKRIKTIQNSPSDLGLETFFTEKHEYYLRKGDSYYSIGGQGSFLNPLKDKKAALKQFIRDNNIQFNKDPEQAMVKIAAYYDHLTN